MRRTFRQALILLAISLLIAVGAVWLHPRVPAWYQASSGDRWDLRPEQVSELGDGVVWIDARSAADFDAGHVPGAILLNEENWGELAFDQQDRLQEAMGKPVVVYCDGSGCERSRRIAERLRELIGLQPVYVLRGDWRRFAE